jgi:hypothetical protein
VRARDRCGRSRAGRRLPAAPPEPAGLPRAGRAGHAGAGWAARVRLIPAPQQSLGLPVPCAGERQRCESLCSAPRVARWRGPPAAEPRSGVGHVLRSSAAERVPAALAALLSCTSGSDAHGLAALAPSDICLRAVSRPCARLDGVRAAQGAPGGAGRVVVPRHPRGSARAAGGRVPRAGNPDAVRLLPGGAPTP